MTSSAVVLKEELASAVTKNLVGRLESVALLFQAVTLASSATTDADAFAPGGSTLLYGLAIVHFLLCLIVIKVGGPFHHAGLWPAVWLGMAFLMPLVIAHLVGPLAYASNPVCTQMCSYGAPSTIVFAFYPWIVSQWRWKVDVIVLTALLLEPLFIMLAMKPNPEWANFVSVTLSGTAIMLGYILGKALGYMCRTAARQQVAIEQRKDAELFDLLHSHVRGCLHAIRAEHGEAAIGMRQLTELDGAITRRRRQIQFAQEEVSLASIVYEHVRLYSGAKDTRIRSVPNIGALTVRTDIAMLVDRALGDLLANAFAHAQASEVDIGFTLDDGRVRLTVADNGNGLPPDALDQSGTSLHRLRADARTFGGDLEASRDGSGTQMQLIIPLQQKRRRR